MERYIKFIIRNPLPVMFFFVAITVFFAFGMTKLTFDTSITKFLPETDPSYRFYNHTKGIYGDVDSFVILAVKNQPSFSPDLMKSMDDLISDIEAYQDFNPETAKTRIEKLDSLLARNPLHADDIKKALADDPVFMRLVERKLNKINGEGNIITPREKNSLRHAVEVAFELMSREMIDEIISPYTAEDISGKDDTLETFPIIETDDNGRRIMPLSAEAVEKFRKRLKRNPVFANGIYSMDAGGRITDFAVIIRFVEADRSDPIAREILEIADSYRGRLSIVSQGQPLVYVWINNYMQEDLAKLVPLVLLVAMLIFWFNFRTLRGVLLPSVTLLFSTIWILGLMGYLGYAITTVGISIPILMIAVGSSYGIHILNQYYAEHKDIVKKGKILGLAATMNHISLTVLLAGFTTVVAFLTLVSHELSAIREWGLFSGIGIVFSVWISASMIPTGLAIMKNDKGIHGGKTSGGSGISLTDRLVKLATKISIHHPKRLIAFVAVLSIISIVGLYRLDVETELLSYFSKDNPIRTSADYISKKFGGRWGFNIIIDSGEIDGVKHAAFLKTIEDFRHWLTSEENRDLHIGRTDAFTDFIKTMNMAMNNDDPSKFSIPADDLTIMDYLELFSAEDEDSDGRPDVFKPFVDPDYRHVNILARLSEADGRLIGTSTLTKIEKKIEAHLAATLPANYSYRITGHPMMIITSAAYIINGQVQSLLLTLCVIFIVVLFLVGNLKAAILSLIPMTFAVIVNFGIMGWTGIPLDVATSLIAAITIGIGVDDTIHFLNTFRRFRRKSIPLDSAITRTEHITGKAIIFTSLALIFGFSVMEFSNFKPIMLFGLLMAITMTATTFGALVVLPSAIKITRVRLVKENEQKQATNLFNACYCFVKEKFRAVKN